jgi:hypothetical protein
MKTGIELITEERAAQFSREGYDAMHDDEHEHDEALAWAATCYAAPSPIVADILVPCGCREASCPHGDGLVQARGDPWPRHWQDKRKRHVRIRQLTIAGALIAAEIDRLQRKEYHRP